MNTQEEVLTFLQNNRNLLLKKYHILSIGLFGSFARNEQTKDSDVDLLIELEDGTSDIYELKQTLKTFLSKNFHRNVDLARKKYLKSYAKEAILEETIYV